MVMSDRDVFIATDGSGTAITATEVAWGHTERRCEACGKSWGPSRCSDSGCTSMSFTDTYRPPLFARIQEKLTPKKAVPRASAEQKAAVLAAAATVTNLLNELRALDGQLREAVNADVAELLPLQGLLNRALSHYGDRSLANVDGISLGLESFVAFANIFIKQIEDNS
jgi:hypothetical protein